VWLKLVSAAERDLPIRDTAKWCRGVARNLILRHWREQRKSPVLVDSGLLELIETSFKEQDGEREFWDRRRLALKACVEELPPRSKRVLMLKYDMGMKARDVGRMLSRSTASVLMFLSRIRRALEECSERKLKEVEA
jgi:RNA polymerase sigma-70 factor (ECF subfamily)